MPQRPLLLVVQQYLADPKRSSGDVHPVWAYARAPNGYGGDAERTLTDQIESFAPGFRERIVAKPVTSTNEIAVTATRTTSGGDIIGPDTVARATRGRERREHPVQVLIRPRLALDPYRTACPGRSSARPPPLPGAGVQRMNGYNAARSALRHLRRA
jgi:phytoene dehydrogenase-like protein